MKRIYHTALTNTNPRRLAFVLAELFGALASWLFSYAGDARRIPRDWQ